MTKFNVGDIVYIKDDTVERFKKYSEQEGATALAPDQSCSHQIGLAKDIPFTIHIDHYGHCLLTNFNDNWGTDKCGRVWPWKGQKYKTWGLSPYDLEKRDMNTVSLHELNRGL